MYYTDEQKEEVILQIQIKELKDKIKNILDDFSKKEKELGINSFEEQEDENHIYSVVIGKLNESFYGYNVTSMMKLLRQNGFTIPRNDIINLLSVEQLYFYRSMLNKFLKKLTTEKTINNDICVAIATDIGTRAKNFYETKHACKPLDELMRLLQQQKMEVEKQKEKRLKTTIQIEKLKEANRVLKERVRLLEER